MLLVKSANLHKQKIDPWKLTPDNEYMYFDGVNPLIFLTNGWPHKNTNKLLLYATAISVLSGGSGLVYIEGPITVLIDMITLWPHACPQCW